MGPLISGKQRLVKSFDLAMNGIFDFPIYIFKIQINQMYINIPYTPRVWGMLICQYCTRWALQH